MSWHPLEPRSFATTAVRVTVAAGPSRKNGHLLIWLSMRQPPEWFRSGKPIKIERGEGDNVGKLRLSAGLDARSFKAVQMGRKNADSIPTSQLRIEAWPGVRAHAATECQHQTIDDTVVIWLPDWAINATPLPAGAAPAVAQPETEPTPEHKTPAPDPTSTPEPELHWATEARRSVLRQTYPRGDTAAEILSELMRCGGPRIPAWEEVERIARTVLMLARPDPSVPKPKPEKLTRADAMARVSVAATTRPTAASFTEGPITADLAQVMQWASTHGIKVTNWEDLPEVNRRRKKLGLPIFAAAFKPRRAAAVSVGESV